MLLVFLSKATVTGLETKLGNAAGGATVENKFPVDIETPRGVKRDVDDDKLQKESLSLLEIDLSFKSFDGVG